jgi:hypothetical protein
MSDLSFKNNVPDPLLSGKELPTFKFELEKSTGKVMGNSFGKEATVEQLPISKGIAGVSMQLEPSVMRELHWHSERSNCTPAMLVIFHRDLGTRSKMSAASRVDTNRF